MCAEEVSFFSHLDIYQLPKAILRYALVYVQVFSVAFGNNQCWLIVSGKKIIERNIWQPNELELKPNHNNLSMEFEQRIIWPKSKLTAALPLAD